MSPLPVPRHTPSAEYRFFVYCPESAEFYCFATAAERDAYSGTVIDAFLDDYWDENVERVVAGELTHTCAAYGRQERPPEHEIDEGGSDLDGVDWPEGVEYRCNYALEPLAAPVVPSPDAGQAVAQRLASAATQRLALYDFTEALAAQIRDVVAGRVDINTARRHREAWEAALLQRLQAPLASLEKVAP